MTGLRWVLIAVVVGVSVPSFAKGDWKRDAMWCLSEMSNSEGGDVVVNLQMHQNAHSRYCKSCSDGKDQYDSVMDCYQGDGEKAVGARKAIEAAGRETVNEFLKSKAPSCCDPEE